MKAGLNQAALQLACCLNLNLEVNLHGWLYAFWTTELECNFFSFQTSNTWMNLHNIFVCKFPTPAHAFMFTVDSNVSDKHLYPTVDVEALPHVQMSIFTSFYTEITSFKNSLVLETS